MSNENSILWSRSESSSKEYDYQISPKVAGKLIRKGFWNGSGSAEVGQHRFNFESTGTARMKLRVTDATSGEELAVLQFYWKDFQRSELRFSDGERFVLRAADLLRGSWAWRRTTGGQDLLRYGVDNPLQRSGNMEILGKDLSALQRDLLSALGLHLQIFLNNWLMTLIAVVLIVVTRA